MHRFSKFIFIKAIFLVLKLIFLFHISNGLWVPEGQSREELATFGKSLPAGMGAHGVIIDTNHILTTSKIAVPPKRILVGGKRYLVKKHFTYPTGKGTEDPQLMILYLNEPILTTNPIKRARLDLALSNKQMPLVLLGAPQNDRGTIGLPNFDTPRCAGMNFTVPNDAANMYPQFFMTSYIKASSHLLGMDAPLLAVQDREDKGAGVFTYKGTPGTPDAEYFLLGLYPGVEYEFAKAAFASGYKGNLADLLGPAAGIVLIDNLSDLIVGAWLDSIIINNALGTSEGAKPVTPQGPAAPSTSEEPEEPQVKPSQPGPSRPFGRPSRPIPGVAPIVSPQTKEPEVDWNVLIYANDRPMDPNSFLTFIEGVAQSVTSPRVRVLIQAKQLFSPNEFSTNIAPLVTSREGMVTEDFRGTRRFEVTNQGVQVAQKLDNFQPGTNVNAAIDQSVDMGSPRTFGDFVQWGMGYPAKRTMLIIWTHGIGWRRICYDKTGMTPIDIRIALERATQGKKLDILRFDSCYTQNIETAYELSGCADYIIGSEQVTPIDIAPLTYKGLLADISTRYQNPGQLAKKSLDVYKTTFNKYIEERRAFGLPDNEDLGGGWSIASGYTMSVLDCSKLEALRTAINNVARGLLKDCTTNTVNPEEILNLRKRLQCFGGTYETLVDINTVILVDLYDLLTRLIEMKEKLSISDGTVKLIRDAIQVFDETVIKEVHKGNDVANSHGLSITFTPYEAFLKQPRYQEPNDAWIGYLKLSFNKDRRSGSIWEDWVLRAIEIQDPSKYGILEHAQ